MLAVAVADRRGAVVVAAADMSLSVMSVQRAEAHRARLPGSCAGRQRRHELHHQTFAANRILGNVGTWWSSSGGTGTFAAT
jgi:hypothetical protein